MSKEVQDSGHKVGPPNFSKFILTQSGSPWWTGTTLNAQTMDAMWRKGWKGIGKTQDMW